MPSPNTMPYAADMARYAGASRARLRDSAKGTNAAGTTLASCSTILITPRLRSGLTHRSPMLNGKGSRSSTRYATPPSAAETARQHGRNGRPNDATTSIHKSRRQASPAPARLHATRSKASGIVRPNENAVNDDTAATTENRQKMCIRDSSGTSGQKTDGPSEFDSHLSDWGEMHMRGSRETGWF